MRLGLVITCVPWALRYRRIHRDFMPLLMPYVLISSFKLQGSFHLSAVTKCG